MSSLVGPDEDDARGKLPVPEDVQDAIRTLIRWTGDDPEREGLLDPERPDDMFEPFAKGGLFRKGSLLGRAYGRAKKRIGR